jgi:HEAT repeat protein
MNANGRNGMSGNGKNGLGAIAFGVQGHREGSRFFSRLTTSLYNTAEYGHSGNSYSYFWDPIGAAYGGPELATAFLKELRWYYALTRQADGSFVNQPLGGTYGRGLLSPTAAQVLIATLPRRAMYLTGKGQDKKDWLDKNETQASITAGRWRSSDVDAMRAEDLIGELSSWSPIAREWAAKTLAKKKGEFVPRLIQLLESGRPEARAGACAALGYLGERAAVAVPQISKALKDEKTIVSISASYALARIGKSAQAAVPDLLRAVLDSTETQPMRPRQQALAYSLGYASGRYAPLYFDGVLAQAPKGKNPLAGVDRQLLYPALAKLFQDSSGRTRGAGAYALNFFDRVDTAAMAQEIYDVIKTPAMNYKMMDDTPRARGLELMARLHLKEGVTLCFETFDLHRWGAVMRVPARFKVFQMYGGNAKAYLPKLRELRKKWKSGEHRIALDKTIQVIEADKNPLALISLHDLVDERFAKDLASEKGDRHRLTLCRALLNKRPNDYFYRAAGLREIVSILGAEAFDELLVAVSKPNEVLHAVAVTLGAKLPGDAVTDKWVSQLASANAHRLTGILDVLAHRKDPKALPAVKKYLEHKEEAVRSAAMRAVAALEDR